MKRYVINIIIRYTSRYVQATTCPMYELSLVYQVNLTGAGSIQVHHLNCSIIFCTVNFSTFSVDVIEEYDLSIKAINMMYTSSLVNYPISIRK